MGKKKILIIGDSVYPDTMGGSHRHIYDISTILNEMGHDITVYSPMNSADAMSEEIVNGFKVERYKRRKNKMLSFWDFIYKPFLLFKSDLKGGYCPDVIHGHWPLTVLLIFLYVRLKKLPIRLVYTFHGPIVEEYKIELKSNPIVKSVFLWLLKIVEAWVLKMNESISTASYYMMNKEISIYGNQNKISTNFLSINLDKFKIEENIPDRVKNNIEWQADKKYVFTLRRLKKRMGIQLLIKAIDIIVKKHPDFILIIGGKGDYMDPLKQLVKELKIGDNVRFLGFLPEEDVKYYYSLSDVCVVPSLDLEGFGLATVESMACGTPVVATNVCANVEILNGITPQLLSSLNPEDMAEKIITGSRQKQALRKKLRAYIEGNFSLEKTIRGYMNIYK